VTLPHATLMGFRAGDPSAFAEVVRACSALVSAAVARHWKSAFEREEAMQEIWIHAFRNRESLQPERLDSFTGWLAVLARRKCIDLLRLPQLPLAEQEDEQAEALAWLQAPAEQEAVVEEAELEKAVEAFRAGLKPGWVEFFDLHFVQGLAYEEVSSQLGISRLRCKYMKKVLAGRARECPGLMAALDRHLGAGGVDAL